MSRLRLLSTAIFNVSLLSQLGSSSAIAQLGQSGWQMPGGAPQSSQLGQSAWQMPGGAPQSSQLGQSAWQMPGGAPQSSQLGQSGWQMPGGATQSSQLCQSGWQMPGGAAQSSQLGQSGWQTSDGGQSTQQSGWQNANTQQQVQKSASRAPLLGEVMQQEQASSGMKAGQQVGIASNTANGEENRGQNSSMMGPMSGMGSSQPTIGNNVSSNSMNPEAMATSGGVDPMMLGATSGSDMPNIGTMLVQLAPIMGAVMQALPSAPVVGFGFPTYRAPGRIVEMRSPGLPHFAGPGNLTPSRGFRPYSH